MIRKIKNGELFNLIINTREMMGENRKFSGDIMYSLNKNIIQMEKNYEPCEKTICGILEKYRTQKEKEINEIAAEDSEAEVQKIEEKYQELMNNDPEIKDISNIEVDVEFRDIPLSKIENYEFSQQEMRVLDYFIVED